jgi:hypothetical protein
MQSDNQKRIIYIPGMKPKPPPDEHRAALWRCLREGMRRAGASGVGGQPFADEVFQVVPWTRRFYAEQRDINIDIPGIERLMSLDGPAAGDVREALHWHKRLGQLIYLLSDAFPMLINLVANPPMRDTLQDASRYFRNENGVATEIRRMISSALESAAESSQAIMLIGHSLGSVIAYDVLWELSRQRHSQIRIDHFLTIGSPLGLNFVKHRMLSSGTQGEEHYPSNIRRWSNLSAVGEMTALDRSFADDYKPMLEFNLVESITDHIELINYFRGPEGLNVHKCYGYMINEKTGSVVANWLNE